MKILPPHACWLLLRAEEVGRLAVSINDQPDIFPVNYVVDHGTLVFRTAAGTKLAAAVLGRSVAVEVDGHDQDAGEAWSVVVKGRAAVIDRVDDLLSTTALPLFPWQAGPKNHFVRVVPGDVTGRRFPIVAPTTWFTPGLKASRSGLE